MQSQGTKGQRNQTDRSPDKEQLERSAEMFEMILQSAPDTIQNYLTLKDIYRQLNRNSDLRRISKALARVYKESGQSNHAAREYAEALETDPNDAEALTKLQEIGYSQADLPTLRAQVALEELRAKCEQKLKELEQAEEAFLKASARARDARRCDDEESLTALQAVEEKTREEARRLAVEHQRWLNEGQTQVFNRVAESLKKKADTIIEQDEFNDIRKSVKKAEKLLASTDKVFEEEWRRLNEQHQRQFQERSEELKRKKEIQLRCTWQEIVARAERDQAAADLALRKVKDELRRLQAELSEKEKLLQENTKTTPERSSRLPLKTGKAMPEVVVVAPNGLGTTDEPCGEEASEPASARTPKDEVGKALGVILVQHGLVSREHLEEAIAKQEKDHKPIGQILIDSGYASEDDIINALVTQAGVPYLPLSNYEVSDDVAGLIPRETALKYALMPVDMIADNLLVTMGIPLSREQKEEVRRHVGTARISYFISSWSDIKAKHEQHYS